MASPVSGKEETTQAPQSYASQFASGALSGAKKTVQQYTDPRQWPNMAVGAATAFVLSRILKTDNQRSMVSAVLLVTALTAAAKKHAKELYARPVFVITEQAVSISLSTYINRAVNSIVGSLGRKLGQTLGIVNSVPPKPIAPDEPIDPTTGKPRPAKSTAPTGPTAPDAPSIAVPNLPRPVTVPDTIPKQTQLAADMFPELTGGLSLTHEYLNGKLSYGELSHKLHIIIHDHAENGEIRAILKSILRICEKARVKNRYSSNWNRISPKAESVKYIERVLGSMNTIESALRAMAKNRAQELYNQSAPLWNAYDAAWNQYHIKFQEYKREYYEVYTPAFAKYKLDFTKYKLGFKASYKEWKQYYKEWKQFLSDDWKPYKTACKIYNQALEAEEAAIETMKAMARRAADCTTVIKPMRDYLLRREALPAPSPAPRADDLPDPTPSTPPSPPPAPTLVVSAPPPEEPPSTAHTSMESESSGERSPIASPPDGKEEDVEFTAEVIESPAPDTPTVTVVKYWIDEEAERKIRERNAALDKKLADQLVRYKAKSKMITQRIIEAESLRKANGELPLEVSTTLKMSNLQIHNLLKKKGYFEGYPAVRKASFHDAVTLDRQAYQEAHPYLFAYQQ